MSIVVFYLQTSLPQSSEIAVDAPAIFTPHHISFADTEINLALKKCGELRKISDVCHITMSSELSTMVGKAGVASVVDGRTPDGEIYDWSKADRAGKMRKSDLTKTINRSE